MRSQFVWSRSTDLRTISRASSAAGPVARLAAATTNAISRKLVGQIVDEIVHRDAVGQRRPLLVVAGIVGPFPGVAQVHVVADGHHHAALVVVYGAPAGLVPVLFIRLSGIEVLRAGYLKPFVQIVGPLLAGWFGQYVPTVRGETRMPSFRASSSATRPCPQVGFSSTIRAIS